ncbi:plasmid partition protein ParG, partial [Escherichia coli]
MTPKSKVFSLGGGNSDTKSVIASMKKQKGPVKKLQVNINEDLHRQFKSAC